MAQQVIAAFFDNRADAENAVDELVTAGIQRSQIRIMPEDASGGAGGSLSGSSAGTSVGRAPHDEGRGFWASLGDLFLPDEDRHTYAEAINRGSIMVSVTVDQAQAQRAEDILEEYGTVDIDEREQSWRSEGWSGHSGADTMSGTAASGTSGSGMAGMMGAGSATGLAMTQDRGEVRTGSMHADATGTRASDDEVIPIVEEQLRIGKRQTNTGRVRVRSYVVETPVHEEVSLRQEHVHVERRPVDRAVGMADENLFRERSIEAEERGEEVVMSKEARVTEELVVKKDVENRTETVNDTVRRTEVEIDDDRTSTSSTSTGSLTDRDLDPNTRR